MSFHTFIREAVPNDARGIYEAHMRSIREVCSKDYSEKQISAWGGRKFVPGVWEELIELGFVWVVEQDVIIKGVGAMKISDEVAEAAELRALYFVEDILGKGFGKKIIANMKYEAKNLSLKKIVLDSTKTAKKFYESQGFVQIGPERSHVINHEAIEGYPMEFVF